MRLLYRIIRKGFDKVNIACCIHTSYAVIENILTVRVISVSQISEEDEVILNEHLPFYDSSIVASVASTLNTHSHIIILLDWFFTYIAIAEICMEILNYEVRERTALCIKHI